MSPRRIGLLFRTSLIVKLDGCRPRIAALKDDVAIVETNCGEPKRGGDSCFKHWRTALLWKVEGIAWFLDARLASKDGF